MKYLVIEGNIGSGKTSLAKMLAKDLNASLLLEQFAGNSFLAEFYKDPERYAFPLELSFLADRYSQLKSEVLNKKDFPSLLISDYFISKSSIFAQATLKHQEFQLFSRMYEMVSDLVPVPDLYVYLHSDTKNLLRNIKKRGRYYEKEISSLYLDKIAEGYLKYMNRISSFTVMIIDVNQINFVDDLQHYKKLKNILLKENYILGINRPIL